MTRPPLQKMCQMCGQNGHVQGVQCPLCCPVCAGETDEEGNCIEFGCKTDSSVRAQGTPSSSIEPSKS